MKKIAAILFFVLASLHTVSAQRYIATDYNNCLHGIKDRHDNWIIKPIYDQIEDNKCGYRVSLYGKWGLIDTLGNVLIPLKYDHIQDVFDQDWNDILPNGNFRVLDNGKYGVVDTAGRTIVPVEYDEIHGYADTMIAALKLPDTWYFFSLKGDRFELPWKDDSYPDYMINHRYRMPKKTWRGWKYGVVGDSGQVILPQVYSEISGFPKVQAMAVRNKTKYGFCSGAGKFIWPISFKLNYEWSFWSSTYRYIGIIGVGPAQSGDKYGLINLKGDTLLPFIYDNIQAFDSQLKQSEGGHLWTIQKGNLTGIFDDKTGWKIPISCTEIETMRTYYTDSDSIQVGLLIYQIDNRWGVSTTAGQVILPCRFEEKVRVDYGVYAFRTGDSIYCLSDIKNSCIEQLIDMQRGHDDQHYGGGPLRGEAPDTKMFSVFEGKENVHVYFNPTHTRDSVRWYGDTYRFQSGKYYSHTVPDSIVLAGCFYVQLLTEPVLERNDVRLFHINQLMQHSSADKMANLAYIPTNTVEKMAVFSYYWRETDGNYLVSSAGDVLKKDGTVLLSGDSLQETEIRWHGQDGSLYFSANDNVHHYCAFDSTGRRVTPWFSNNIGDFSDRYIWRITPRGYSWQICDLATGKPRMDKKDDAEDPAPIWDSITVVFNREHGNRLYNIRQQKYLAQESFNYILPLNKTGTLFAMKTCRGKIGVMDAGGKWLTDTIWTAFTPVGFREQVDCEWSPDQSSDLTYFSYYVFSNDTGRSVLMTDDKIMQRTSLCWPMLWSYALLKRWMVNYDYWGYDEDYATQEYVNFQITPDKYELYRPWHMKCIVDTLYCSLRYTQPELPELDAEEGYEDLMYYDVEDYNRNCQYCFNHRWIYQPYFWTRNSCKGLFTASYVSDSVLSFSEEYRYLYVERPYREWMSNVFLFADGPHCMLLDSLFKPDSDWKNFIINTTMDHINNARDVQGDCQNPVALPILMRQEWQVESEGLVLYPPGFREGNFQMYIIVPWAKVDPYLRADVKEKLPINLTSN